MVPLARAQSQPAGLQAAFAKDAGTLSDKFTGLARVMSAKYDWKPAQGVRSVAEVFNHLQKAITALSDNDLQAPVKLFGRDWTKQDALMHILEDQHEHLGQSIAYARSNGVVPPWSK